ncbi:MAG: WYL domain-containing protein [Syntrophothermus sp.]|nr:WYL domain-containing protein [Syntrophothermus sp.]
MRGKRATDQARPGKLLCHPSQKIEEELSDGSVVVSFEVCGLSEMIAWLLQWGDMAEVLSPDSLRDEVRQAAEKIARVYTQAEGWKT